VWLAYFKLKLIGSVVSKYCVSRDWAVPELGTALAPVTENLPLKIILDTTILVNLAQNVLKARMTAARYTFLKSPKLEI